MGGVTATEHTPLENVIRDMIARTGIPGWFQITFQFVNPDVKEIDKVYVGKIDEFTIQRDFTNMYADVIRCSMTLFPRDLFKVLQSYDNLKCALSFTKVAYPNADATGYDPIHSEYKVIISNPDDLLKKFTSGELMPPDEQNEEASDYYNSIRVPISMQLIPEAVYEKRHLAVTTNAINATPEQMLYFVANALECKNVSVIPPDNKTVYEHFSLPPMLSMSDAFNYVQERYGCYTKGLGYYLATDKLYVYPAYEDKPELNPSLSGGLIHFYKVPINAYAGSDTYTAVVKDDFHCMVNDKVTIQNVAATSAENVGNAIVATRSSTAIDVSRHVTKDGAYSQPDATYTVVASGAQTADSNMQNATYTGNNDNAYVQMSKLVANQTLLVTFVVRGLDPTIISPNHPCYYHYEEEKVYKLLQGIVIGVKAAAILQGRPNDFTYMYTTELTLSLSLPDQPQTQEKPKI